MILVCGIPNAGKTTYSQAFQNVVHYDDMIGIARQRYTELNELATNGGLIADGVFGERKRRVELVESASDKATCIWIDTPVKICLQRERSGRMRGDFIVLHHAKTFEPPTLDEGWDEIIIVRNNESISYKRET